VIETKAAQLQEAPQNVLENESAVVADVCEVVDRGAAGIHRDFAGFLRFEGFGLIGESIVEADFAHGGSG